MTGPLLGENLQFGDAVTGAWADSVRTIMDGGCGCGRLVLVDLTLPIRKASACLSTICDRMVGMDRAPLDPTQKTDQEPVEAGMTRKEDEATVAEGGGDDPSAGDSEHGHERQPFDPDQLTLF